MNDDRTFELLAAQARQSRPPLVDVADRVMARIDLPAATATTNVLMWVFSAASAAAAAAVILMATVSADTHQDPMAEMISSMMQVL